MNKDNTSDFKRVSLIDFFKIIFKNKIKIIVICVITVFMTVMFTPKGVQQYKFTVDLQKKPKYEVGQYSRFKEFVVIYDNHIKKFLDNSEQEGLYIEVSTKEKIGYLALDIISTTKNKDIINNYIQYSTDVTKEDRIQNLKKLRKSLNRELIRLTPKEISLIAQIIATANNQEIQSENFKRAAERLLNVYRLKFKKISAVKGIEREILRVDNSIKKISKSEFFQKIKISEPEVYGSKLKLQILFGLLYGLVLSFIIILIQIIRKNKSEGWSK